MGAGKCLDPHDPNAQWAYCPSYPAAIVFTVIFCALTLAHITLAIVTRKVFCWVVIMAVSWETIGFVFRILAVQNQTTSSFATASQLLILLAPLWVNAFIYMVLGRMAYYWLPNKRIWKIRARTLTKSFVWADIVSFLVQGAGGSMISGTDSKTVMLGIHIYMGGIGLQQLFVLLFVGLAVRFHLEVRAVSIPRSTSWRPLLYTLYLALAMITVRIIFRLVEFSSGIYGTIPSHEAYFYILEAVPMLIALGALAAVHPGRLMIGDESEFSKLKVIKGKRRWWCCGLRKTTKIDLDFELPETNTVESWRR